MTTQNLMALADAYANIVVCRFVGTAQDAAVFEARAALLTALEAQAAEIERLKASQVQTTDRDHREPFAYYDPSSKTFATSIDDAPRGAVVWPLYRRATP